MYTSLRIKRKKKEIRNNNSCLALVQMGTVREACRRRRSIG